MSVPVSIWGVQLHGLLKNKWDYRIGIFNGTGSDVNMAKKTMSDDLHIPSLLYAGRLAYMPKGALPSYQGDPDDLTNDKVSYAASVSYNVEANWESSNDLRLGVEYTRLINRLYLSAEGLCHADEIYQTSESRRTLLVFGGICAGRLFCNAQVATGCPV